MNQRERLMATLAGKPVDRPAVCFYEINGLDEKPDSTDPFHIYSHPSWYPLLDLARARSDRIVMRGVPFNGGRDPLNEHTRKQVWYEGGVRFTRTIIATAQRNLTGLTRQDPDVNTVWHVEHLLKDEDDVRAFLEIPPAEGGEPDISGVLAAEKALGDTGIVMIDTADPLCRAAELFDMASFTVIASTEPALFRALLDRFAAELYLRTEAISRALPGRLWRIVGPEYASPPYLHPRRFHEYVTCYDTPMVRAIQAQGGYARIHCHGRIRLLLDEIAATGCDGLDPIEPPPQGDIPLAEVRERVGQQMVLFGNLEASDLENLPEEDFRVLVQRAIDEGTRGTGRGFVLMPSSCPYGRVLTRQALRNYEVMIEAVGA
jgi:hypothetical protein